MKKDRAYSSNQTQEKNMNHHRKTTSNWIAATLAVAWLSTTLAVMPLAVAADAVLGPDAAKAMPIADVHFHVMPWMNPQDLIPAMDRNNIRWAGGAGALGGPARNIEVAQTIGKRYIMATGQGPWLGLKQAAGQAVLENADAPGFKQALANMERGLADPRVKVLGEIHVNTSSSAANPSLQLKIRADAPTLKLMLELAGKYGKPLNIHAQWDSDTAQQVEALARSSPASRLIISHCGVSSSASDIRGVLQRNANVSC
ncbi:MAG: hypothetical protein Q7T63_10570, partial [Burkholderiaceae bacterium]|nr:hypothetical protein [Burkholderiaceae bacterium]